MTSYDQMVRAADVVCPYCGAGKGEKCRSKSGRTDMNYWHRSRIDEIEKKRGELEVAAYKAERKRIYSDDGLEIVAHILQKGALLTEVAGSFKASKVMRGDTFIFHNCVDWLVENGYLAVVAEPGRGQDQILRVIQKEKL